MSHSHAAPISRNALLAKLAKTGPAPAVWLDLKHSLPTIGASAARWRSAAQIDAATQAALQARAAHLALSPEAILIAAVRLLLARYAQKNLIGCVAVRVGDGPTLAVPVACPGEQSVAELAGDSEGWLGARSAAAPGAALVSMAIGHGRAAPEEGEEGGSGLGQLHLDLGWLAGGDGCAVAVAARADLFTQATLDDLTGQLVHIVTQLASGGATALAQVATLPASERERQLYAFNDTAVHYPGAMDMTSLVRDALAGQAGRTVLYTDTLALSGAQLDLAVDQVASDLLRRGVRGGSLVGVCLPRNHTLVIAMLAIQRAGAAYVPLDPAYPRERLAYILQDSGAELVLADAASGALLDLAAERKIDIVALLQAPPACDRERLAQVQCAPEQRAYLIYTSGSTGAPKGVVISHRNGAEMCLWARAAYPASAWRGVFATTSVCFDLSVFEIFATLIAGGTVILAQNALALTDSVHRDKVTLLNTVPSIMAALLQLGDLPPGVNTVNLAGEALARSLVERVYAQSRIDALYNLYGPSEDTTYSTWASIAREDRHAPLIGRPLPNTHAYILDDSMQPVPLGVTGELYLGGLKLSSGYLNQDALTAEKFLRSPFATPGGRIYRTGDLARHTHDGALDYLGRTDQQVKLRGFRIELGEVDAVLHGAPHIEEAVASVQAVGGEPQLVAYVVGADGAFDEAAVVAFVAAKLPAFMVPALVVRLASLPKTANGKIDRKALPAPDFMAHPARPYQAPSTPTERALCALWQEVLGLERVGVDDSFFQIGGHSLLATRLVAALATRMQIALPILAVFEHKTVRELATVIDSQGPAGAPAMPGFGALGPGDAADREELVL